MEMQLLAWIASSLVFASFFMKTIMPLRAVAIASNVVFIGYALMGLHFGVFDKVLPILILHLALLPLNVLRLREIQATIRGVKAATSQARQLRDRLSKVFDGQSISVESDEGGNEIVTAANDRSDLDALAADFGARWDALPTVHQTTLAACSTRLERALRKRIR